MNKYKIILNLASSKELIIRALKIAFFVGIILNLINQGQVIINLNYEAISLSKLLLTFCVPFCVSMYTAISMKLKFQIGQKASFDTKLRCISCNSCLDIKKNEIIPFCEKCKDKTSWKISSPKDKKCQ